MRIEKSTFTIALATVLLLDVGAAQAELREYWLFDDGSGTSAANEIGDGNTGTLVGPPAWITNGLEPKLTGRSVLPSTAALDFEASVKPIARDLLAQDMWESIQRVRVQVRVNGERLSAETNAVWRAVSLLVQEGAQAPQPPRRAALDLARYNRVVDRQEVIDLRVA